MVKLLITEERRYETKKSRSYRMKPRTKKKVTFTQYYKKRRGLSHGSGNWPSRNDNNRTLMSIRQPDTRRKLRPGTQSYNNSSPNRPFERRDYLSNNNDRYNDYKARSPYQPSQDQPINWGGNNNYSRSLSTSRQNSSFTDFLRQPQSNSPNPSVFNRFGKRDPRSNIPYDKKFSTSNSGNQPNVVRFTTTDDENNELSGLCPLKYYGLRVQLLLSPRIQDSASTFSTSPPETLKI